jgi:hypothetical protein
MRNSLLAALAFCFSAVAADSPLPLRAVYRLKPVADKQQFITADDYEFKKRQADIEHVAFVAVCTNNWPAGLVPIFAVEKTNRIELRRRPALGQENSSEPLFYALPPTDEPEAAKLAGRWDCLGIRGTGTKEFFGWDLAIEGEKVAGRFDQFTDFRFGRIAGGTFRSNQLELRIEYLMDAYVVKGTWRDGKLKGDWTRVDESENGTWEATRPPAMFPTSTDLVTLYEWRRPTDDARRYFIEGEKPVGDWQRAARPLCRVWKPN